VALSESRNRLASALVKVLPFGVGSIDLQNTKSCDIPDCGIVAP